MGRVASVVAVVLLVVVVGLGFYSFQLLQERAALEERVAELESQKSGLETKIDELESQRNTLESKVSELEARVNELEGEVSRLQRERAELLDQLEAARRELNRPERAFRVLLEREVVNVPSRSYVYYDLSFDRPGYLTIEYQASGNIELRLVWESGPVSYDSGNIDAGAYGTISLPVLPGSGRLLIINPSLLSGLTATVTVTYTYWQ